MATRDLREASGIAERARFDKAMTQLQKTLKIIPSEVLYEPTFTYIWSIPEARFPEQLKEKVEREEALKEIARAYSWRSGNDVARGIGACDRIEVARSRIGKLGDWSTKDSRSDSAPGIYRLD